MGVNDTGGDDTLLTVADKAPIDDGRGGDVATYLIPLLADLSRLATRDGHGHLAYLLDLARLEASEIKGRSVNIEH